MIKYIQRKLWDFFSKMYFKHAANMYHYSDTRYGNYNKKKAEKGRKMSNRYIYLMDKTHYIK